jgi:hypothetical protein
MSNDPLNLRKSTEPIIIASYVTEIYHKNKTHRDLTCDKADHDKWQYLSKTFAKAKKILGPATITYVTDERRLVFYESGGKQSTYRAFFLKILSARCGILEMGGAEEREGGGEMTNYASIDFTKAAKLQMPATWSTCFSSKQ